MIFSPGLHLGEVHMRRAGTPDGFGNCPGQWLAPSKVAILRFSAGVKSSFVDGVAAPPESSLHVGPYLLWLAIRATSQLHFEVWKLAWFNALHSLLGGSSVLCCYKTYGEDLQTVCNLLFGRLWHSFISRTFKAQDKPVVAYQGLVSRAGAVRLSRGSGDAYFS